MAYEIRLTLNLNLLQEISHKLHEHLHVGGAGRDHSARALAAGHAPPEMRMIILGGFNEGWICFRDPHALRRQGRIGIEEAIGKIAGRPAVPDSCRLKMTTYPAGAIDP